MNSKFEHRGNPFFPEVMVSGRGILEEARRPEALLSVARVLELMPKCAFNDYVIRFYDEGLSRFGKRWGYADLLTVLYTAARWLQPKTYMEIGVCYGRSAAIVSSVVPDCHIVGFDLWQGGTYHTIECPTPDRVYHVLRDLGHRGAIEFIPGDSKDTVPNHPTSEFDLVLVDGDHGNPGGPRDLVNAESRVKTGGALVFDDVGQLAVPWLISSWNKLVKSSNRWTTAEHLDTGAGVAVAVRRM